jgi:hypothetical protein
MKISGMCISKYRKSTERMKFFSKNQEISLLNFDTTLGQPKWLLLAIYHGNHDI